MNRNRKAAKFSFMYLVSSKKDFCLYFDKEFFGKKVFDQKETRLTFWRYCNHEAKMKRKIA